MTTTPGELWWDRPVSKLDALVITVVVAALVLFGMTLFVLPRISAVEDGMIDRERDHVQMCDAVMDVFGAGRPNADTACAQIER